MDPHGVGAGYDAIAADYERTRTKDDNLSGMQNRDVEQPTTFSMVPEDLQGHKLLDIGCGPGIHAEEYANRGAEVTGIDLSEQMVQRARERAPSATFSRASVTDLPFEDNTFDVITCSFVLSHIDDIATAIEEMVRTLKPGGQLFCSDAHPITDMFRESQGQFIPSHSYFDENPRQYNIADTGKQIPGFPRALDTYFNIFLSNDLLLNDFKESRPPAQWKKRYPQLEKFYTDIPLLFFFEWEKPATAE